MIDFLALLAVGVIAYFVAKITKWWFCTALKVLRGDDK